MSFPYFRYDTRKEIVLLIESTTRGQVIPEPPPPTTTTRKDVTIHVIKFHTRVKLIHKRNTCM